MANEWVLPTGYIDSTSSWGAETLAYNNNTDYGDAARCTVPAWSWSNFLILTIDPIYCSKLRFFARYEGTAGINKIDLDVYYNGAWHNVFEGSFINRIWVEKTLGGTYYASQLRVRFHNNYSDIKTGLLYEAHFYKTVGIPKVTTNVATDVGDGKATLNGNITSIGSATCTIRGFKYKEGISGEEQDTSDVGYFDIGTFSKNLIGLDPTKKYYFKAYATNSAGTGYGEWKSFGEDIAIPTVSSSAATSVNHEKATLNGNITETGGEDCEERGFQWKIGAGGDVEKLPETGTFGIGTYSLLLSDLDANITYCFRAYAKNAAGTSYGTMYERTTGTPSGFPYIDAITKKLMQSFTASFTYYLNKVSLMIARRNTTNMGTVTVGIYAVDGNGLPTGVALTTGTIDGNTLPLWSAASLVDITLTQIQLTKDTQYAIVVTVDALAATQWLEWGLSPDAFAGGFFDRYNGAAWEDYESGAKDGAFSITISWLNFTTDYTTPEVITHNATDELETQVTGNGEIVKTGGQDCYERGFEYGLSKVATWEKKETVGSYGVGFFDLTIDGLTANTEYWYRAWAKRYELLNKLDNPATLPTGIGLGAIFSHDSIYLVIAHSTTPYITIYKRDGDVFTKLANPANLPAGNGQEVAFSHDSVYLAVAHSVSPYITIYKRSGDTFTKLSNPDDLPAGSGHSVAFSHDSVYLAIGHATSPYVTIYKRSGDTFTKLTNPADLPAGDGWDISFSHDSTYLAVAHGNSPYITIYKRSVDTFTKLTNPADLPAGCGDGVKFSHDSTYLAVGHDTSPYITIYKRNVDTFTKLANPADLPTGAGYEVVFSHDSTYLAVIHETTPFIIVYKRSGDTFTKLIEPVDSPAGDGYGAAYSHDSTYLVVANDTSPYLIIYKDIYKAYGEWVKFITAAPGAPGDKPSGYKNDICSDDSGYTYILNRSLTDDGASYESYFVLSTDLSGKKTLHTNKRLEDIFLYFVNKGLGTAKIYVKRDTEPAWQYAGEISLAGEEEIIIKHLAPDFLAKTYLIKFVFENDFEFIGAIFESIPIGDRP